MTKIVSAIAFIWNNQQLWPYVPLLIIGIVAVGALIWPMCALVLTFMQKNSHLWLSALLVVIGILFLYAHIPPLAGALFGAGALLLGAWITEWNNRQSMAKDRERRATDARTRLAAELQWTIERVLHIYQRAIENFTHEYKTDNIRGDLTPYMPTLFLKVPQFLQDLPGDDATALITFYDALRKLKKSVSEPLPETILDRVDDSADHALDCIKRFKLSDTLSSQIEHLKDAAAQARKCHLEEKEDEAQEQEELADTFYASFLRNI